MNLDAYFGSSRPEDPNSRRKADSEWSENLDAFSTYRAGGSNPQGPGDALWNMFEVPLLLSLIGISSALLSFATGFVLQLESGVKQHLIGSTDDYLKWSVYCLYCVGMALFSCFITHLICKEAIGGGLSNMKTILGGVVKPVLLSRRLIVAKVLGLWFALMAGLSVGREGPFVHISGAIADQLMKLSCFSNLRRQDAKRLEIIACACASGVSATFGNAFGGVLFSIEFTASAYLVRTLPKAFLTSVVAMLAFLLLGVADRITLFPDESQVSLYKLPQLYEIGVFVLLGLVGSFLGVLFVYLVDVVMRMRNHLLNAKRLSPQRVMRRKYLMVGTVTLLVAVFMYYELDAVPHTGSGSYQMLQFLFRKERFSVQTTRKLGVFAIYKFFVTLLSVTLPLPVGLFSPVFVVGGVLGRILGETMHAYSAYNNYAPWEYALLGAAAFATGVTRAISTAVIIFELACQPHLGLPIAIIVLTAHFTGNRFSKNVYEVLMDTSGDPYMDELPQRLYTVPACDVMVPLYEHHVLALDSTYRDAMLLLDATEAASHLPTASDSNIPSGGNGIYVASSVEDLGLLKKEPHARDMVVPASDEEEQQQQQQQQQQHAHLEEAEDDDASSSNNSSDYDSGDDTRLLRLDSQRNHRRNALGYQFHDQQVSNNTGDSYFYYHNNRNSNNYNDRYSDQQNDYRSTSQIENDMNTLNSNNNSDKYNYQDGYDERDALKSNLKNSRRNSKSGMNGTVVESKYGSLLNSDIEMGGERTAGAYGGHRNKQQQQSPSQMQQTQEQQQQQQQQQRRKRRAFYYSPAVIPIVQSKESMVIVGAVLRKDVKDTIYKLKKIMEVAYASPVVLGRHDAGLDESRHGDTSRSGGAEQSTSAAGTAPNSNASSAVGNAPGKNRIDKKLAPKSRRRRGNSFNAKLSEFPVSADVHDSSAGSPYSAVNAGSSTEKAEANPRPRERSKSSPDVAAIARRMALEQPEQEQEEGGGGDGDDEDEESDGYTGEASALLWSGNNIESAYTGGGRKISSSNNFSSKEGNQSGSSSGSRIITKKYTSSYTASSTAANTTAVGEEPADDYAVGGEYRTVGVNVQTQGENRTRNKVSPLRFPGNGTASSKTKNNSSSEMNGSFNTTGKYNRSSNRNSHGHNSSGSSSSNSRAASSNHGNANRALTSSSSPLYRAPSHNTGLRRVLSREELREHSSQLDETIQFIIVTDDGRSITPVANAAHAISPSAKYSNNYPMYSNTPTADPFFSYTFLFRSFPLAIPLDPSPYQIVDTMHLSKVDMVFRLLSLNQAYVTNSGRLVGIVTRALLREYLGVRKKHPIDRCKNFIWLIWCAIRGGSSTGRTGNESAYGD